MAKDYSLKIALPNDSDGYTSFDCPLCNERFKLSASEIAESEADELFCAVCGLRSSMGSFLTKEFLEAAEIKLRNMAQDALSDGLKKRGRSNSRNSGIKWNTDFRPKHEPEKTLFESDDLELIELPCCEKSAKVRPIDASLSIYCSYCGSGQ